MILSNYTGLQSLIESIGYLTENETDDFVTSVYHYILYNFGNRTVSPIVESGIDNSTIAKMISYKYYSLWTEYKKALSNDIPITDYTETETTLNQIYGYNSTDGVNDYKNTKTYVKGYSDVFSNLKSAIDFFNGNNYYSIIALSIVKEITLEIYDESEVTTND